MDAQAGVIEEIPFHEEGTFPLFTVVTCGVFGCVQLNDQGPILFQAPAEGTVQDVALTMTWEASSLVMAELGLTVAWDCQEESGCETEYAFGTSPLELAVDDLDEEEDVFVVAWAPHRGTEQANLRVSHVQDFQIEGTFTTLVPGQGEDEPEGPS